MKDYLKNLIKYSQDIEYEHQYKLVNLQNKYAKEFTVDKIDNINPEISHYLKLTSLPFALKDFDNNKLERLWKPLLNCFKCNKSTSLLYQNSLPTGNINAKIFVIGDCPGVGNDKIMKDERMFVFGPSSHLLRNMLIEVELYKLSWFTNLVGCPKFKNKNTEDYEIKNCFNNLRNQINIIKPKVLISLGNHVDKKFRKLNLVKFFKDNYNIDYINIHHPAYYARKSNSLEKYVKHIKSKFKKKGWEL